MAVVAIANILKSSLGPVGLDKMLVDELGDMTVTNDGATILKNLEVEHPAAKVLVELSNLQDQEVSTTKTSSTAAPAHSMAALWFVSFSCVSHSAASLVHASAAIVQVGDGTTSVVIFAAELLKQANELVKSGVHPTLVIAGLNLAKREACKFIANTMSSKVEDLGVECILNAARTSMSSKIIGGESAFFAKLAVDAVSAVRTINNKGKVKYPIKAINILKAHGKSLKESQLVNGYALNCTRAAQGMPTFVKNAKIALLDIDLRKMKLALGVQVMVSDPSKLADIRKRETDVTKERIELLLNAGANVVLTTQGIDDVSGNKQDTLQLRLHCSWLCGEVAHVFLCFPFFLFVLQTMLKYFVERGVIAVRRCNKSDLKAIAKCTGGQLLLSLGDLEGNESVDASVLGEAEVVEEGKVGDGELLFIKGCKNSKAQSIILRGANDYMLDEVDRSLHDSLCVVKRVLESKVRQIKDFAVQGALFFRVVGQTLTSFCFVVLFSSPSFQSVVPGGGAVEVALSVYMEHMADTMGSREQLAVACFAQSLLVIPKTLAVNGAYDATELVAQMRSRHHAAQTSKDHPEYRWSGLNLEDGAVRDNLKAGVLEPAISKVKMIRFATEAAVTILRIDDAIKMNPAERPGGPGGNGY